MQKSFFFSQNYLMLGRKIAQMNGDGSIVRVWDISVSDISRQTGVNQATLYRCLSSNAPWVGLAGGYKWKYVK